MEYKTAILKLVESVHDEKALKIIYSFLQGYLFSCTRCPVSVLYHFLYQGATKINQKEKLL